jgi:hypothetical protein
MGTIGGKDELGMNDEFRRYFVGEFQQAPGSY